MEYVPDPIKLSKHVYIPLPNQIVKSESRELKECLYSPPQVQETFPQIEVIKTRSSSPLVVAGRGRTERAGGRGIAVTQPPRAATLLITAHDVSPRSWSTFPSPHKCFRLMARCLAVLSSLLISHSPFFWSFLFIPLFLPFHCFFFSLSLSPTSFLMFFLFLSCSLLFSLPLLDYLCFPLLLSPFHILSLSSFLPPPLVFLSWLPFIFSPLVLPPPSLPILQTLL